MKWAAVAALLALLLFGAAAADGEPRYDRRDWHFDSEHARRTLSCSAEQQLDHIVALHEAWRAGGHLWSEARRRAFANDPDNWWCISHDLNREKSDSTLADWGGGSCAQRKQIAAVTLWVKTKHGLTIDARERGAIQHEQWRQCPGIEPPFWCVDPTWTTIFPTPEARGWAIARCAGVGQ